MDIPEDVTLEFTGLRLELMDLEERFNPRGEDLSAGPPRTAKAWPGMWDDIEKLAGAGLSLVDSRRTYFLTPSSPSRMHDDGMFWHRLLLLISGAGAVWARKASPPALPLETIESVMGSLLAVSEYTAVVPDEVFRANGDALRNFVTAFPGLGPLVDDWADSQPPGDRKGIARAAAESARMAGWPDLGKLI
jgi:hypothetical protein